MKEKTLTTLLLTSMTIMIVMIIVMFLQDKTINKYRDIINGIDTTTTTVTKIDTVYETKTYTDTVPMYITKTITKRDTLYKQNDTIPHIVELKHKTFYNTITEDKDTISYEAHISGYGYEGDDLPKLDSINLHTSHKNIQTIEYVTQVIKVQQKQKLITTSPSITAGYNPINKQWGAMVGVSVNFNIWNK